MPVATASLPPIRLAAERTNRDAVLILGASSAIARWTAYAFARRGYELILAGRDHEDLMRLAGDVRVRYGVAANAVYFDALAESSPDMALSEAVRLAGGTERLEGVVLTFGAVGDQRQVTRDAALAARLIDVNFTSAVRALTGAAEHFESRGRGFIVAVGSVAGDRGRQSNYVYGAAKAGLAVFLQGLRHRPGPTNITVLTVRPSVAAT